MNGTRDARIIKLIGSEARTGIRPDPNITAQGLEVAGQVEGLAFGTAEFKLGKEEENTLAG